MKDRYLSEEERRQWEKEERSRQRIQDQAYREAQRAIHARIYGSDSIPEEDSFWDDPRDRRYDTGRRRGGDWGRTDRYDTIPDRGREEAQWSPSMIRWDDDPDPVRREPTMGEPRERRSAEPVRRPNRETHPPKAGFSTAKSTKKRSKKKIVMIVAAVAAVLLLLALAVHTIFVHRPEVQESEGVHPVLQEAGRREDVYTFLLVGRDDGGGGNTDTIMVGCYDVKNETLDVMSLYRDTLVDVPWEVKKINSVYNNTGMDGLREEIKDLMGYAPDYYFLLELDMVEQLVDAIGGVDYEVPCSMHYDDPTQDLHIHFEAGMQHLNGEDAVKVLRWRKNNSGESHSVGDVGRVEIQHSFLKSMMGQALSITTLTHMKEIIGIVDNNLSSNLSYGEMMWFGEKFLRMDKEGLRFHTMPGDANGALWSSTYKKNLSYVLVNDSALRDIVNTYMNPYTTEITADMQHVLQGTTVDNLSGGGYSPVG